MKLVEFRNGNIRGRYSVNGDWNERIPFVFTYEWESLKEAI